MPINPSLAISRIPRSGIRKVFDEANKYPDCIRLEVGEPSFPTPPHIVAAADEAGRTGFTRYTPNAGIPELREAIAQKVLTRNSIQANVDQVIVTTGAVSALFSTLLSVLNPGEEILIPDPGWPNYFQMTVLLGVTAVHYQLKIEHGMIPQVSEIESRITSKTRAIIINSPGNPTGAMIPNSQLIEILEIAKRHDLWVISDEVYDEIYFDTPPISMAPMDSDGRVITVFSFSKTYAMTGWRVGYLVGTAEITSLIMKSQEPTTSCVNSMAQKAAVAALTGPQDCVQIMRESYKGRSALVKEILDQHQIPYVPPKGAFYIMVNIGQTKMADMDFVSRMINENRVAVVPGSAFGPTTSSFVRISLASSEQALTDGVSRLSQAIQKWS